MITREQVIQQSVQEYARRLLFDVHGYPESKIEIMDAFNDNQFEGAPDKNYLAAGFNFDDQGRRVELGSQLTARVYTIEWFIVATDQTWGENLAHALKFSLESDEVIPLLTIYEADWVQFDALILEGVSAEHVPIADPKEWEKYVFRVALQVRDEYLPAAAFF